MRYRCFILSIFHYRISLTITEFLCFTIWFLKLYNNTKDIHKLKKILTKFIYKKKNTLKSAAEVIVFVFFQFQFPFYLEDQLVSLFYRTRLLEKRNIKIDVPSLDSMMHLKAKQNFNFSYITVFLGKNCNWTF